MVVAKTRPRASPLAAQFADHGRTGPLERGLPRLRLGRAGPPEGHDRCARSTATRRRGTSRRCGRAAARRSPTGSCWRTIAGIDGKPVASLLSCRLETGRTHQIRVHLAHIGHPLLGDETYGTGFKTKAACLTGRPARLWRLLEDRHCMPICSASSTPYQASTGIQVALPADLAPAAGQSRPRYWTLGCGRTA